MKFDVKQGEEHSSRVFENRMLRKILGPKKNKQQGTGQNCTVGRFIICILHQIYLVDQIKKHEMGRSCGKYGTDRKVYTGFWWGT